MELKRSEIAVLIGEVQALAFLVNQKTKYAVFVNYSGHVEILGVSIRASKENFTEWITSDDIYVSGRNARDVERKLKLLKLRLRKILRDNKVDYNELSYTIREERDYHLL
ncbi:hypothetical protein FLT15_17925 [Paenibacillus thiaminolyticus]|uniref:hypothetical protein n=1 Tax=Paenibacillus thiaminolyticus TaxID=49283 RepID=UPI001161D8D0|nr:hypothetical protein [Paenibacillus thiaminolyticus]NGP60020.1 hypothetical protein [Paenibacillus thiaminolyticus]NGP60096.1 hypothetical protein [Paenibacillus thiaminolyticus]NGP60134.1 hypothetical protein [Paenibacillus thiaminolyticus]